MQAQKGGEALQFIDVLANRDIIHMDGNGIINLFEI